MTDIALTVTLPVELMEKAQAQGLLTSQRLAAMLEAELTRLGQWQSLQQAVQPMQAAFRTDYPNISEDEVLAMMDALVKEVRIAPLT